MSSLEEELRHCDEFAISVAFLTMGGITQLLQVLKELEIRNIPGRILTTDYLMFNNPAALRKLSELKNIKLKMFMTNQEVGGFHTKGYIFKKEEVYHIIMGSSNMTAGAITKNREWNTKIISTEEGEIAKNILKEFNTLWNDENAFDYNEIIEQYALRYKIEKEQKKLAKSQKIASMEQWKLKR